MSDVAEFGFLKAKFEEGCKEAFKGCFVADSTNGSGEEFPTDGKTWVHYNPNWLEGTHIELIWRGDYFYVEFHFESSRQVAVQQRKKLDEEFLKVVNRRLFVKGSYYSTDFWRIRIPVVTGKEIPAYVRLVSRVVDPVLKKRDGTQAIENCGQDGKEGPKVTIGTLPCQIRPREVSLAFSQEVFQLPPVQRGKVWNAARTAALWDSMLRGFSIGGLVTCKGGGSAGTP